EFSRNLNWQNIGYSAQWVLFGGFFLYLWWRSVRTAHLDEQAAQREALEAQLERAGASTGDAPAEDDSSGHGAGSGADAHRDPPAASASASPVASGRAGPTPDKDRSEEPRLNSSHVSISYAVVCSHKQPTT